MIRETIVTTLSPEGRPHVAPMGIRQEGPYTVLAPFRPSATLDNVLASGEAVVNFTDDARIFAGCITGRHDWPTVPADTLRGIRLADTLAHAEMRMERWEDEAQRPRLYMRTVHEVSHAPFRGFNRARAAVLEGAILVSRLGMLPWEKIEAEVKYLTIAIDKTAGPEELEAWGWLIERISEFRLRSA